MSDDAYQQWKAKIGDRIRRPIRVEIRSVWPSEPAHFTPWLANNLDYLDILHLGKLTRDKVEFEVPGTNRFLDILALSDDGQRVAIENQYRRTDHDHLTRGLAYAINGDARWLVVISEEHLPEFVEVAKYLNEVADTLPAGRGIGVFLVNLSVLSIDSTFVPQFEVVVRPSQAMVERTSPPPSGSVDDFLAEQRNDLATAVAAAWRAAEGCEVERRASTAIALTVRNPSKARGRTVMIGIYEGGSLTLNVGYLWETGAFASREALIDGLESRLGRIGRTGKGYYCSIEKPVPQNIAAAGAWVADVLGRFAETGEPDGDPGSLGNDRDEEMVIDAGIDR